MKKVILSFVLLLLALFSQAGVHSMWSQLNLQVRFDDPTEHDVPIGRSPVSIPSLSLVGYNLLFNTPCDGSTLRIVNEDGDIEYSTVIPANTTNLMLPSFLSGEYELQIIQGLFCFYCIVEL